MKKIITAVLMSVVLFMSTLSHAIPSNYFKAPTCQVNVNTLPIYEVSVRSQGKRVKHGTIFLIDKDLWATAYHVIQGGPFKYFIMLPKGGMVEAELVHFDEVTDIAILRAYSEQLTPLARLSAPLEPFEAVWNVGRAGLSDKMLVSFQGIVMDVDDIFIQSSAIAFLGMSGGPQFRCNGERLEVIAVVTGMNMTAYQSTKDVLEDGTIVENYYFSVQGSTSSPHLAKTMIQMLTQ